MATRKPASSPNSKAKSSLATTASYQHSEAKAIIRPEAGAQTRFKKKKPAATWRYDSSLAPELQWDAQNPAREQGEARIAALQAAMAAMQATLVDVQSQLAAAQPSQSAAELSALLLQTRAKLTTLQNEPLRAGREAAAALKSMSRPFLNWAGKAERLSFDVPTLPMFIHERLSTQAILDSVSRHKLSSQGDWVNEFFGHPERSLPEQLMKAYEHPNGWQNRMVLGDSLVVMNSMLHYENMGGQVQMAYIDPPYGVKFGSNFQPFVRKRDVTHNDDEGLTREPEMVKAYRDTWELGLHSYLTYLRDRLLLTRELLAESGSVFVQISDENLHHVREVMDEVFGAENFVAVIAVQKTGSQAGQLLGITLDYLIWYAKNKAGVKYRQLYEHRKAGDTSLDRYDQIEIPSGSIRRLTANEIRGEEPLPEGRRFRLTSLFSDGASERGSFDYNFLGKKYACAKNSHWKTNEAGLNVLELHGRLSIEGTRLRYKRYAEDFPVIPVNDRWDSMQIGTGLLYAVQTSPAVIQRCMLMTTDPGDLVLDPTCGSGTTAVVAESWGRRWITIDTSRVPLALARQRLLTATFKYWDLKEPHRGPAGGFVYKEKKNKKGEHVGGIVPHITLGSIANNEPPKYEVLVDRPEVNSGVTRVCGPFVFEATIPTASNFDGEDSGAGERESRRAGGQDAQDFVDRMIEVLRSSPVLHLAGGKTVQLSGIRRPAKTLFLAAEAMVSSSEGMAGALEDADAANGGLALQQGEPVALMFGPEYGPVAEVAVLQAWQEATAKAFTHLYVIGFAIEPKARQSIGEYSAMGMPTTYVQATPDILMGDLLKNMRSSQIFSVCGQPDVAVRTIATPEGGIAGQSYYEVQLRGLDVFDPVTMDLDTRSGLDVPAWFLDTDYNGLVFRVCQAFFPRTQAWDNLKRALKADFDESVWAHLAGDTSTPFNVGQHRQIAVKVIDDRGNELMVVKKLEGAQ
ncbi:MAG: site-specific DNA-methyltransferase [Polaromonas sp.]|uniref:site-specific DNA-methyltransferase n=1 Tax=Polaromonas sp. TaxID=1869339 RepID=UPI00273334BD|nr:site-specific DNA-methyltransferase [Polaromonas sp.]MDP2818032.1 site-specific DNA-methyltransferase [Polaromonas sp.]